MSLKSSLTTRRAVYFSGLLEREIVRLKKVLKTQPRDQRDVDFVDHLEALRGLAENYRFARGEAKSQRAQ